MAKALIMLFVLQFIVKECIEHLIMVAFLYLVAVCCFCVVKNHMHNKSLHEEILQ